MSKRVRRLASGVLVGLLVLAGTLWVLCKTFGNFQPNPVYAGHTIRDWQQQFRSRDAATSNAAFTVVSARVVPQLVDAMFHDTRDSQVRLWLINLLNGLPGVQIDYAESGSRRAAAAELLGELGPAAGIAVPELVRAVQGTDAWVKPAAIRSLGKLRTHPQTVIPLLIPCLENEALDVPAAQALGEFGSLAKPAVPKLLPLLHAAEGDDRAAAQEALRKIDPQAAAQALRQEEAAKQP